MKNLQIGKSGIEVPFLGMGTWAIGGGAWWGDNDDSLSVKAIQTAVEQGIRWIDTAPIYGLYHSEEVVGEAMKHIDRDKVVLSTKCGLEWRHETPVLHKVVDGVTVYRDLSAQSIIEDVEDMKGNRLLLFTSDWAVRWAETHNETLELSEFGNI